MNFYCPSLDLVCPDCDLGWLAFSCQARRHLSLDGNTPKSLFLPKRASPNGEWFDHRLLSITAARPADEPACANS